MVKNLPANAGTPGDEGLILGSGRSSGVGNCSPLWYSCLENHMNRRAWRVTVSGVVKSWTRLSVSIQAHSFLQGTFWCKVTSLARASLVAQLVKNPPAMQET